MVILLLFIIIYMYTLFGMIILTKDMGLCTGMISALLAMFISYYLVINEYVPKHF
ncbi:hypothetical protein CPAV1605_385 [seawater metagenome]|uniref:Uncharacterized protein n=1 Tax=seawater metagenome TaxID=1561972 RepID=A0A5E8CLZ9_9ZZZZ